MGDWERHRKVWWIVLLALVLVSVVVTLVVRVLAQSAGGPVGPAAGAFDPLWLAVAAAGCLLGE